MTSSDAGDAGALDLGILEEATGGDLDLMQDLAVLYVNDADLQLRALDDALQNKELDRLNKLGHALCGSSAQVGASVAAEIFRELEEAARDGDQDRIRSAIRRGRAEFARVRAAFAALR
jgi:HPt (histidine-containing phosphotransfer) domain-containing protein